MADSKNTPATTSNQPAQTPKRVQEEITTQIMDKITAFQENGQMKLPLNYVPGNALKSAFLILQDVVDRNGKPALEVCTQNSIANALFDMVIKGLNPVKKQCYFVVYGNELNCDGSRFGNEMVAKRVGNVKDFKPYAVYEKDEFAYEVNVETGLTKIITHKQSIENKDHEKVKGAYAIIIYEDGTTDAEVMSIKQIRQAWNQGAAKGASPAHKNFTDEMAIKTVVNRACKKIINSTDDADLFEVDEDREDRPAATTQKEISQGANRTHISMSNPAPQKTIPVTARETQLEQPEPEPKAAQPDPSPEDQPPY